MATESDDLDHYSQRVVSRFDRIRALVLASIDQAREFRDTLQEQLSAADGEMAVVFQNRLQKVKAWLRRGEFLRAQLYELSHTIGVTVRKAQLGLLERDLEEIRRLDSYLSHRHRAIIDEYISAVGNGIWERTATQANRLLADDVGIQESEELRQVREELEDVDAILEGDLEQVETDVQTAEQEIDEERSVSNTGSVADDPSTEGLSPGAELLPDRDEE